MGYYVQNSSKFVYRLVKILPRICPKCVLKTLNGITLLTHTSHLTIDLSHTCAPPHLIEALCAMTGWS